MATTVQHNPEQPAPPEILQAITPLLVDYIDRAGTHQRGTIEVHKDIADDIKEFFIRALELRFPIEKVVRSSDPAYGWDDDKLIRDNASSGFNYRLIKWKGTPSLHGLGLAIDINPRLNPYFRYDSVTGRLLGVEPEGAVYTPNYPGTLSSDHPLVLFMKERGFEWGGDWLPESGRTDYQHFQKK